MQDVCTRAIKAVLNAEAAYANKTILLVSHGDTLQILQTAFLGEIPAFHRSLPPLNNAELRRLN